MKYISLFLLILTGCSQSPVEYKFYLYQTIKYKIPSFYRHVCDGFGTIVGKNNEMSVFPWEKDAVQYDVQTNNGGCPDMRVKEKDIEEVL